MLSKASILIYAMGIIFLLGGTGVAQADNWDRKCHKRFEREERELDKAIARHGFYSRQANHERYELNRLRAECRYQ